MHLADAFIQSDLQLHSGYTFLYMYMCSLGIEPTTFRSADAMFYHWATQERPQERPFTIVKLLYVSSLTNMTILSTSTLNFVP